MQGRGPLEQPRTPPHDLRVAWWCSTTDHKPPTQQKRRQSATAAEASGSGERQVALYAVYPQSNFRKPHSI